MNIACPHRHIVYRPWQSDTLIKLFGSSNARRAPAVSLCQPQRVRTTLCHDRKYSSQKPSAGTPYDALESLVQSEEKNGTKKQAIEERVGSGPEDYRRARLGRPRRKIDPYSPRSRQNVKAVIEALEDLADQDAQNKQSSAIDPATGKPWQHQPLRRPDLPELPRSPIFKKQRKKDVPLKEMPTPAEQPLSHDPWARMLAEPVRLCRGSGVRLPISLLSNWRLTKHPTNGEVYLMPSQLADLEHMEKVSSRQEVRWRKKMRLRGAVDKHAPPEQVFLLDDFAGEADKADNTDASISGEEPLETDLDPALYQKLSSTSRQPGTTPAVRILPYDNLINLFSLTTLRHVSKRVNTTIRLLPRLWLDRFEQARHYERNREAFEKLTGERDTSPPTVEATLDLNRLQWQTDIGERLMDILRKRVIAALGRVAILNAETKKCRLRHISAISMTKTKQLLDPNPSFEISSDDHNDTSQPRLLSYGTSSTPDATEPVTSPNAVPITQGREVAVDHALTPRFFLYLGPRDSSGLEEMANPERQAMIPPLLRSPVKGRSQRFPVFPIRAMLGEEYYASMLELLEGDGHLQVQEVNDLDTEGGDYLLMLKPSARNEFIEGLLREVWRLWRYGGGRRWMDPENEDYEGWKAILSEMHRLQARHVGQERMEQTEAGIDELVRQIEEGAVEDQDFEERAVEDVERAVAKKTGRVNGQLE